jgi:signal transduction histidine kinase
MSTQPPAELQKIRVLVVDDDDVDRERIRRALRRYSIDYEVFDADSLDAGVEACHAQTIDIVILDTYLQTTNGLETLRRFRSLVPSTAIVLMSGLADEHLALQSIQNGAEDFVSKDGFEKRWFQIVLQNAMHRHRMKQQLTEKTKRLEQVNNALRQFTYVSSHELQEPLRAIQGFGEKLRMESGDTLDTKCRGYVQRMVHGAERMHRLINDLLDYSKHTVEGSSEFASVDLNNCLREACENLSTAIEESGAELHANDLPQVMGVNSMLTQLFQNLIGNALKYKQPGKNPVISISWVSSEDEFRIDVKDNGIGIERQYHEQIFGLFKRLHRREEFPGTGIGLAICTRVAELHDGRLTLESSLNQGSTFSVHLPLERLISVEVRQS